jgi:hypothetical protein
MCTAVAFDTRAFTFTSCAYCASIVFANLPVRPCCATFGTLAIIAFKPDIARTLVLVYAIIAPAIPRASLKNAIVNVR